MIHPKDYPITGLEPCTMFPGILHYKGKQAPCKLVYGSKYKMGLDNRY